MLLARHAGWSVAIAFAVLGATGCSVAVGAGVGAVVIGAAVVSAGCYDAVDVRLIDGVTGVRTCAARMTAVSTEGSEATFASCYHAALPRGDWTLRAEQPGRVVAIGRVVVQQGSSCEPAVQSLELVIHPVGSQPAPSAPAPQPLPVAPPPAPDPVAPPTAPGPTVPPAPPAPPAITPPAPVPPASAPVPPDPAAPPSAGGAASAPAPP